MPGSGRVDQIDFSSVQEKIKTADASTKVSYQDRNPNRGYGGKYGTEQVMDKVRFVSYVKKVVKLLFLVCHGFLVQSRSEQTFVANR